MYRPFENGEEVEIKVLICKESQNICMLLEVGKDFIAVLEGGCLIKRLTFEEMYNQYTYFDGTPCGKLVQESGTNLEK